MAKSKAPRAKERIEKPKIFKVIDVTSVWDQVECANKLSEKLACGSAAAPCGKPVAYRS